ncbi:hypothetical protein [Roseateles sp. BYS78W]
MLIAIDSRTHLLKRPKKKRASVNLLTRRSCCGPAHSELLGEG